MSEPHYPRIAAQADQVLLNPTRQVSGFLRYRQSGGRRDIEMETEKVAGILGAIVAAVVLAVAFAYGPIGKPSKPAQKVEQPAQPAAPPAPAARGPVVRDVPQQ